MSLDSTSSLPDTSDETRSGEFLESTKGRFKNSTRVHHEAFPVKKIIFDATENYRWASNEAMERDIGMHAANADGSPSDFEVLKNSIEAQGVKDPVELVEREDGIHVVSGFTRVLIARQLALKTIPAYVYPSTMSEAEVHFLQLRENAVELKRAVNWVQELDSYFELIARYTQEPLNMSTAEAAALVSKTIGKHTSTMKSRRHFYNHANKRIQKLAREGVISCTCLQQFLTADKTAPYDDTFIVEVLERLKVDGKMPDTITPQNASKAIRNAKIKSSNTILEDGSRAKKDLTHTGAKIRQSPAILRDMTMAMARALLLNEGLSITSSEEAIEALVTSSEWATFVGMGLGAGDVAPPPVLEQVLGGRGDNDQFVHHQQEQFLLTANYYARSAFIHGFIQIALEANGVKNIGLAGDGGWLFKETTIKDKRYSHRDLYYSSVRKAAEHQDDAMALKDRVLMAWKPIFAVLRGNAPA